jgi:hypothetical protein
MMLYLLKLTALALVVTTSSVHALDERYVLPALRGSANVSLFVFTNYTPAIACDSNSHFVFTNE